MILASMLDSIFLILCVRTPTNPMESYLGLLYSVDDKNV